MRIGCAILAAGASTRMGTPKQLVNVNGRPLLLGAVEEALGAPVWPVAVVLGANAGKIRPLLARSPVLIVENPAWAEGMASSIRAGVSTMLQFSRLLDGVVLALCDQPAFSAASIERLIEAQRATGRSMAAAHYSGHHGSPALFLREHFAALGALTGDEGARVLLKADPSRVASVEMPDLALDIDTPEDLNRLAL